MSIKLYHSFINDKDLEFTRMHENSSIVDVVYDKKIIARLLDRSHTTYKYIAQLELYNWSNSIATEMIIRTELCIKFLYYYNKHLTLKDEEVLLDYKDEEKIKMLKENAISYLLKTDDQSIDEIKTNSKDRAIVRGTMPKPKSRAGRPRIKG